MKKIPELLSPAGSLKKLKMAFSYGADSVYLGANKFGLRQRSDNFNEAELALGVEYAHHPTRQKKVFVVLNSFLFDKDLEELPLTLGLLNELKVDALIVSDLGTIETCKRHSKIPIHLSTQASSVNSESAKFWRERGVSRVVLGREASIEEAKSIKLNTGLEVEMFIHGSMCMAYSGHCVISNYTKGRDSNRGGCAHSCRFEYSLGEFSDEKVQLQIKKQEEEKLRSYFMSSKDLNGLKELEKFIHAGIDSLKVEGRNKSFFYCGITAKVYSEALNFYKTHGHFLSEDMLEWEKLLQKLAQRGNTQASLIEKPDEHSVYDEREHDENESVVLGVVKAVDNEKSLVVEVLNPIDLHQSVTLIPFHGKTTDRVVDRMETISGQTLQRAKPGYLIKIPWIPGALPDNVLALSHSIHPLMDTVTMGGITQ